MDIPLPNLAACYLLLIVPLAAMLWLRVPLVGQTLLALVRMTLQLAFVGLYLQVVFRVDQLWLTSLWLIVMITVADFSIVRGCSLNLRQFLLPMFLSLLVGTAIPMLFFTGLLLGTKGLMQAQYAIPIGGMILGNCLRADIIGIKSFYEGLRNREASYLHSLAQGASRDEALRPHVRDAFRDAMLPTLASMATIGLVALPGMMTGVILAGSDPMTAIKYQIAIMIAIFSGTAMTVVLGILLTVGRAFNGYGILKREIFTAK